MALEVIFFYEKRLKSMKKYVDTAEWENDYRERLKKLNELGYDMTAVPAIP